jgi:ACS family sodium-dependent inorganic phosphate cotransporter/ACS family sodium-dependent inorganic phosphate cotransporter-like MFS transporter 9
MDRICLSVAMLPIAKELGWAEGVQGIVQSAFLWGYLANQLLGGTLADKFGGKKVMAVGIIFFSLASALLPLVAVTPLTAALGITLPAVLAVRFLVGFGEGVALPSMNNLIATRIPSSQRATALGMCFMGFHTGNLVGLLVSPLILAQLGWRPLFYIFGLFGGPLLALWSFVVPNLKNTTAEKTSPAAAASLEQTTKESAPSVTLGAMLKNRAVWAIIVANFANHWGYFIYLNWMPTYFYKVLGMDLRASSFMSFLPWLVMAAGSSFSGIISDALVRSGTLSPTAVRKIVQTIAFLGPVAPLLVLAAGGLTPTQAVVAMTCALGITSLGQFVTNMSDVAPRHAGRLFGLCNTFGSFAGILGVSVAGLLVEKTGSFGLVFQITAVLNIIGTVVWNMFATAEKQFD